MAPGDVAQVDVTVAGVDAAASLGGYTIDITFNPAVVRLDSVVDSGFIKTGTTTVICETAPIDNVGGHSRSACATIPQPGSRGVSTVAPKALMHASFTALAPGTSALDLSGTTLDGVSRTPIEASLSNGSIQVTAPGGGAPSATRDVPTPASTTVPSPTAPTTSATGAAVSTPTPTPAPASSSTTPARTPSGLRVPNTGDPGGGGSGSRRLAAVAGLAGVLALVSAGGLALARRRHG